MLTLKKEKLALVELLIEAIKRGELEKQFQLASHLLDLIEKERS